MLIRFLRFWRGTIRFQVSGKYLERFLNLAARAKIPIWNGLREDSNFCGESLSSHEAELKEIAEKVQLQWLKQKDFGISHLGKSYGKRVGFLSGAFLLMTIFIMSQQFVWKITVNGNETVSSQLILDCTEQCGLKKGVWKSNLDVLEIADQITLQFDEIAWAAVNLRGTVAEIEVVERVQPPELIKSESDCNVISRKAGQLVQLEVYDGKKVVTVGDTVKQGQLLVSGILTDRHGRTIYRHARAKAVVEYLHEEVIEIPLRSTELITAAPHQNSYRLFSGDFSIPLTMGDIPNSDDFSAEIGLVESGIFQADNGEQWFYSVRNRTLLPWNRSLILQVQQYTPAQTIDIHYTESQAKELALLRAESLRRKLERQNIEITSTEMVGSVKRGSFHLIVSFTCREEVAEEVEIIQQSKK